jgi:uncharacterized SAM-binding protein YcdF (DUF218 family)
MKKLGVRIAVMILSAVGLAWFIGPIFWNVKNIGNMTGIAVCAAVFLIAAFYPLIWKKRQSSKAFHITCRVISVLFIIGVLWAAVLTGFMLYGANAFGARAELPKDATVVVLGSKVSGTTPSADLMARITAAGAYLKRNPQANCVVSGGQGPGELVTEASVMREYLVKGGIDASRIFMEDKSKNTEQNLKNSLAVIEKNGFSRNLAIVTDEYHEFRAGKIAERLGAKSYAVCAQTPWYIFSSCYARELLALTKFLIIP